MSHTSLECMNAVVLHAIRELRFERVSKPSVRPGNVRVRVGFCGICGSDIPRCFEKGTYRFPTICGHEFAGAVDDVAADVEDFQIGDRVVVFPLIWNDDHPACEQGMYHQSEGYDYLGSRSDGGFAECVIAPARNLIRVPANVSLKEAAMTEPAAVALHAVRRSRVRLGESVAVFGLGPIGLMVAQWLRACGADPIILLDVQPAKLELARQLGFANVFDSRAECARSIIEDRTDGNGVHVAIEAAGVPRAMIAALEVVRRRGRVVLLGNPSSDVALPAALISQLMRREIEVLGTWNSEFSVYGDDDDWRSTLAAISDGRLKLKPLISHIVPLSSTIEALHMMRNQTEFCSKVLVQVDTELASQIGGLGGEQ